MYIYNIYIYIYIYIYICIYIYIYIKTKNETMKTMNVPSRLCTWYTFGLLVPAMCNSTSYAQAHELPQSHCGDNREGTLFSWLHLYYVHLASAGFEHWMCRGSFMATLRSFLCWSSALLVHLYQQWVTVHHVPKCMSYHKTIVAITERAHCLMIKYIDS